MKVVALILLVGSLSFGQVKISEKDIVDNSNLLSVSLGQGVAYTKIPKRHKTHGAAVHMSIWAYKGTKNLVVKPVVKVGKRVI